MQYCLATDIGTRWMGVPVMRWEAGIPEWKARAALWRRRGPNGKAARALADGYGGFADAA